ncbi:helix-turn-helix transcriptional regulator [Streptomyces chiangmaiensis]|uniref:AraC family transcriptional regulator n=1 Tax=Streptomyces chiangmaiensis TaxID=766497 RepID=A0ABU7FG47_9ACTN|nr:AraC family transcriptional regulator [Streptomyces chiangmaiensis]MED7823064.1 AraC family transcriptional regulator [Streptomyces chiangmaiensis]
MGIRKVVAVSEGPVTRLGQVVLAGEVEDDEPIMPSSLRIMDQYVLTVLLAGEGGYRDAEGRDERLLPGAHTIVPPGVPHWYGTDPGERWTELFVVFAGPLFDAAAGPMGLSVAGPRYPRPVPPIEALRGVLRTPPRSQRAAEHQLLALADWLLDAADGGQARSGAGCDYSPEVAHAVSRLSDDLTRSVELRAVAAESGLTYDTFRRRFTAEVGQTPSAFRSARRLQTAATLLRHTDMTHREIARTLGFADEFHFSRRFRAHFGMPPRKYRAS